MRGQIARSIALGIAVALVAAPARATDGSYQVELGERTYQSYCALCHGIGGAPGMFADALKKAAPDLTEIARRNGGQFPERKVVDIIRNGGIGGHGTMRLLSWEKYFRSDSTSEHADELVQALTEYLKHHQTQ